MTYEEFKSKVSEESTVDRKDDPFFRLQKCKEEFEELHLSEGSIRIQEEREDCFYTMALYELSLGVDVDACDGWANGWAVALMGSHVTTKGLDPTIYISYLKRYLISGWEPQTIELLLNSAYKRLIVSNE